MTSQHLKKLRDRLWQVTLRVQRDAATVSEQAFGPSGGQADGGLSNAPMHLADIGTEAYLQELNATLLENEEFIVSEALAAIRRIDDGTFGRCENCGKTIPDERLDALPYTRHCAPCAETLKPGPPVNLNAGRPTGAAGFFDADGDDRPEAAPPGGNPGGGSPPRDAADSHAAGTAGGRTAVGGLAGTNRGRGDPDGSTIEEATARGRFDVENSKTEEGGVPQSGPAGGAVGGTPAGKRSRGNRAGK